MSKLDATGTKTLEEILASIRKTLSGDGGETAGGERGAAPAQVPPEPVAHAEATGEEDGLLSARLAGALAPVNGVPLDEDVAELLAPESKGPSRSDPDEAAKPADAGGDGKSPLWFLREPSAGAESSGAAGPEARTQLGSVVPAPAEEVKLSRPEVLRASLPPLFGGGEERAANVRAPQARAPKVTDAAAPSARMRFTPAPPGDAGRTAADNPPTPRTQPPPAPVAEEIATSPPARSDPGMAAGVAPAVRAPAPFAAVPPPVAEASQPVPEGKPGNGSSGAATADGSTSKAPTLMRDPLATRPAPASEAAPARTLEQVIGELLEPVVRQWLETNLPRMVGKVVRDEVARAIAAERSGPKA